LTILGLLSTAPVREYGVVRSRRRRTLRGMSLWDFIVGNQKPSKTFQPGHNWDAGNWCRYKKNSRCMYPTEMNHEATKVAGYPVWIPVDRGFCPRGTWKLQSECPMGHAGQNVPNGFLDANTSWEEGGQRIPPGW